MSKKHLLERYGDCLKIWTRCYVLLDNRHRCFQIQHPTKTVYQSLNKHGKPAGSQLITYLELSKEKIAAIQEEEREYTLTLKLLRLEESGFKAKIQELEAMLEETTLKVESFCSELEKASSLGKQKIDEWNERKEREETHQNQRNFGECPDDSEKCLKIDTLAEIIQKDELERDGRNLYEKTGCLWYT